MIHSVPTRSPTLTRSHAHFVLRVDDGYLVIPLHLGDGALWDEQGSQLRSGGRANFGVLARAAEYFRGSETDRQSEWRRCSDSPGGRRKRTCPSAGYVVPSARIRSRCKRPVSALRLASLGKRLLKSMYSCSLTVK